MDTEYWGCFFVGLVMALTGSGYIASAQEDQTPRKIDTFDRVAYLIDFSDYVEGSVEHWLVMKKKSTTKR